MHSGGGNNKLIRSWDAAALHLYAATMGTRWIRVSFPIWLLHRTRLLGSQSQQFHVRPFKTKITWSV